MNFSSTTIISQAWELWKKHIIFSWLVIGVIFATSIIFGIIDPKNESFIIGLISMAVTLFLELGAIALFLKLVRTGTEGKIEEIIGQRDIYLQALAGNILYYIAMAIGFILLIIPGIYVAVRFMFLPYVFVDQKLAIKDAFNEASRLSEGIRMNLFGFSLLLILFNIAGLLVFFVGLLVTIPVSAIAMVMMYEWAKNEKSKKDETTEVVTEEKKEEVVELPAATPEPVV